MVAMFLLREPGVATLLVIFVSWVQGNDDCLSIFRKKCLKKSEVGILSYFMEDGDPCFTYRRRKQCFVIIRGNGGSLQPCSCTDECGCADNENAQPTSELTCDNNEVPTTFDCGGKWCEPTYNSHKPHTMCTYCGVDSKNCGDICQYGLTEAEQDAVLEKHNSLRRRVAKGEETGGIGGVGQPPATNMKKMSWDSELATIAQRWADQCIPGHDEERKTAKFSHVGQNYGAIMRSVLSFSNNNMTGIVENWYSEVNDFSCGTVSAFEMPAKGDPKIGHYTQVVWAESYKVGCGYVQHPQYSHGKMWYTEVLVCNYGPSGNYWNQPVYIEGSTAADCINGDDDGLCL